MITSIYFTLHPLTTNLQYSTSLETNPHLYSYIFRKSYWTVHAKGEVWAAILYEVFWNLVDLLGFDDYFQVDLTSPDFMKSIKGNQLMLLLVIDGMKMQVRPLYLRNALCPLKVLTTQ